MAKTATIGRPQPDHAAAANACGRQRRAPLRVGAVIPCKNEAATIRRCLMSLRAQEPRPDRILVVDNGSTDGSLEIARELADEVLEMPVGRIAALRNAGATVLGDVDAIAFVDADCELAPGWLAAAREALGSAELVGYRSTAPPDATWVAAGWADIEDRTVHRGSLLWTTTLAIRAGTFDALGGFDVELPTGEDSDLSRRTVAGGGRLRFVPGMASVHHGFPRTLGRFLRRERWHTSTPGWLSRMSGRSRGLVLLSGGWAAAGVAAAGASAVLGTPRPILGWAALTAAAVPALGTVVGRSARHALRDGALLAIWAAVRVSRLPRELLGYPADPGEA